MKLKGPFSTKVRLGRPELIDGAGRHLMRSMWSTGSKRKDVDLVKQIAAALNAYDAEESRRREPKPTNQWGTSCKRDGWNFDVYFGGELVDLIDVVKLLNKLGARPPKRRPAKGGAK